MVHRASSDLIQSNKEPSETQLSNIALPLEQLMEIKKRRTKCSIAIKIVKLISAILVPLTIGVFTVLQTLQESNNAQLQRDAEYQYRTDDQFKTKVEQQREDAQAIELRIQTVYDNFMTELQPILRISNQNLTESDLTFVRAKTFATLDQIDSKRKSYLIQFLYDIQLLFTKDYIGKPSYRSVDLDGADLSNCKFGDGKKVGVLKLMNLKGIRLSGVRIRNSSFENVNLTGSTFENCDLTETNFTNTMLININFKNAIVDYSNFINVELKTEKMDEASFKNAIFSGGRASTMNKTWHNCNFSHSTFKNIRFTDFLIEDSTFDQTQFADVSIFDRVVVSNVRMRNSSFENIVSQSVVSVALFDRYSDLSGTTFRHAALRDIKFDNVNLERCQIWNVTLQKTAQFIRVNMLSSNFKFDNNRDKVFFSNSILPNGSFLTSFLFGMNLLENGDAEQQCNGHDFNQAIIPGWDRRNVVQLYYNLTSMESHNVSRDGQCLFFGGKRYFSLIDNYIEQLINVSRLTRLFDLGQTKFVASALLGGIDVAGDSARVDIQFKNENFYIDAASIDPITNDELKNKTSMIFKRIDGKIPIGTTAIYFYVRFKQKHYHPEKYIEAMADNLNFIIEQ